MTKYFAAFLLILTNLSILSVSQAQGLKVWHPKTGTNYSPTNFGPDNYRFLREADVAFRYDFEQTFFALENAVAQNPQSADALLRRAIFKKTHGMEAEASQDFQLAQRINPYAADLYRYSGPFSVLNVIDHQPNRALTQLDQEQKLVHYYRYLDEQIMRSNPEAEEASLLEDAIFLIDGGQLEEALTICDELLRTYPNSAVGYDLRGLVLLRKGDFEGAEADLLKAVELAPDFAIAWYNLAQVKKAAGDFKTAKEYLDRAISLESDLTKALFERALLKKKMGNKEGAVEDYSAIIENKGAGYLTAYLNRGITKKMLGDFEGALVDLNVAIDAYPNEPELLKNRGNLYLLFGYPNRAIEDYTLAIQQNEDFAEAYYNRGLAHMIRYDVVLGCEDLEASAELGYYQAEEKIRYFCKE